MKATHRRMIMAVIIILMASISGCTDQEVSGVLSNPAFKVTEHKTLPDGSVQIRAKIERYGEVVWNMSKNQNGEIVVMDIAGVKNGVIQVKSIIEISPDGQNARMVSAGPLFSTTTGAQRTLLRTEFKNGRTVDDDVSTVPVSDVGITSPQGSCRFQWGEATEAFKSESISGCGPAPTISMMEYWGGDDGVGGGDESAPCCVYEYNNYIIMKDLYYAVIATAGFACLPNPVNPACAKAAAAVAAALVAMRDREYVYMMCWIRNQGNPRCSYVAGIYSFGSKKEWV